MLTTSESIKVIAPNSVILQGYSLYTISGAKVATGTKSEITTSYVASGIYILKLDFDKGIVVKKVVVK